MHWSWSHFGRVYRIFSTVCGRGAYVYFMMIKAFDTDMVDKWMSSWST